MIQSDREDLLAFLMSEIEQLALRAGIAGDRTALLHEAQELMAIRLSILRRRFNENQLPLPLERAA